MAQEVNQLFLDFLERFPEQLKKFLEVVDVWYEMQGQAPPSVREEDGPREWVAGEEHDLTSNKISLEDLEAIEKGYASAAVKERAKAYVKGFIAGIMLVV